MRKVSLLWFLIPVVFRVQGQVAYTLNPESVITITGTSTIHDWTSKVNSIDGKIVFIKLSKNVILPQKGKLVDKLQLSIPVKSIESPRGPVMDSKTYEALKSDEFPDITFTLNQNELLEITDKVLHRFKFHATGDLTIAGFTKTIDLTPDGQRLDNGSFRFSGEISFKMSEYNVKPPTAMFGQIVTGDKVTIAYNLLLDELK